MNDSIAKQIFPEAKLNGPGTHFIANCPFCHKKDHFYLQRKTDRVNAKGQNMSWMWICQKCTESGRIRRLLWKTGFGHLTNDSEFRVTDLTKPLNSLHSNTKQDVELFSNDRIVPLGFKRVYDHWYLNERGFTPDQYLHYQVGTASILNRDRNYIFFLVMERDIPKGYVGRLISNNSSYPRYCNSESGFNNLLLGYDEIVPGNTKTVILVEGAFDKTNTDKCLGLLYKDETKCLVCLGKKINETQIQKLILAGIEEIIIMYDNDAVNDMKKYSAMYSQFISIKIALVPAKDPGVMNVDQFKSTMSATYDPLAFKLNVVQRKILH